MTTFHDDDLFTETFDGFGEEAEAPRRRMWPTVVALAVAAALVVGGLVWLKESPRGAAQQAVSPTTLLSAFDRPQSTSDLVSEAELDGTGITLKLATTRLLLTDADGGEYAAVSGSGRLCVLTVPTGDLASATCVRPVEHTSISVSDHLVVTTTGTNPKLGAGWNNVGPNVWTHA